jgi:hypothetical protein
LREREREREREKFIDNQEVTERADDGGGEGWEGRRTGRVTRLQRVRHTREFGIAFVYRYTLTEKQQREEEEARHHIDACVDHVSSIHIHAYHTHHQPASYISYLSSTCVMHTPVQPVLILCLIYTDQTDNSPETCMHTYHAYQRLCLPSGNGLGESRGGRKQNTD